MGSKFKIAAMEPGFIAHKTEIGSKNIGQVQKERTDQSEDSYKPGKALTVLSQTCTNCGAQHLEESARKRCTKCGSFLPKGILI